jgi:catechol 2,3-dioxygenase-like lactoylglutathione lyase family enzyme
VIPGSHHVVLYSHEPDSTVRFFTEVVGLEVFKRFHVPGPALARTLGWPDSGGATAWLLGRPPAGMVEVLGVPESLRDQVRPGIALLSFAVRDLDAAVSRLRERLIPVGDPVRLAGDDLDLTAVTCEVDGLPVEFLQFPVQ